MWDDMNKMGQSVILPWLIARDFNANMSPKDRLAGAPVNENEIKDFSNCVKVMGINELQWKGNYFTWNNKQVAMQESQAGLIEYLGMMHGWINGGMSY